MSQSLSSAGVMPPMNTTVAPCCGCPVVALAATFTCAFCGAELRVRPGVGLELVAAAPIFTRRELARLRSAVEAIDSRHSRRPQDRHATPMGASRITLEVTDVHIERLHDITEDDARAEGVSPPAEHRDGNLPHVAEFSLLWDRINVERAAWVSNPWIWRIAFRRVS